MIKLVAFDWNGTLFADTKAVLESVNEVQKAFSLEVLTLKRFRDTTQVPISEFYSANGMDFETLANPHQISSIFHPTYEKKAVKIRTRQNTKLVLAWLEENKIERVIISNHVDEMIDLQLNRLKIKKYFSTLLANPKRDFAIRKRTKRKRLERYAKEKGISFAEILVVGDALEEIEIAKEIGTLSVAITDGHCSTKRLKAAKPDYLISDLGNLINIIRDINTI
ncbi:hypothetical protein A2870_01600 [Candidatus Curtissbacteria bacterium RIFCSPHIGHO2_01_FULL_41_11]|uniref:Phosphatase n=1 Tax=Candidatus Curtissbacteria bacterium RIFCSPHIGHO2_01_FULL_41_11 TaxID=1797711 RepID=A0A1F5G4P2_9BACT|nr:MAG: hypothetical protein A2870_01600 [Candidatus Curtissbacteria bacterium RIFCSPHIGHO2_01_FULL_41_11]